MNTWKTSAVHRKLYRQQNCCFFSTPWKHFWCLSWGTLICLSICVCVCVCTGKMSTKLFYKKPRGGCSLVTNNVVFAALRKDSLFSSVCMSHKIAAIMWAIYQADNEAKLHLWKRLKATYCEQCLAEKTCTALQPTLQQYAVLTALGSLHDCFGARPSVMARTTHTGAQSSTRPT